ncbi:hypothetical protein QP175_18765 [Sphingomonas aerolata]|uniref:hypothetical protein n=1 Tax=Sphingomonas aerolata TaxID=185951 RepID=UPI002FDF5B20
MTSPASIRRPVTPLLGSRCASRRYGHDLVNWQEARAFVIAFCLFKPRAPLATGLLVAIAGLVEALGLVLIIPLLQIAGGTGARGHWSTLLDRLHIDSRPEQITLVLSAFAALMLVRAALISIRQSAVIRLELEFLSSLQIRLIERLGQHPGVRSSGCGMPGSIVSSAATSSGSARPRSGSSSPSWRRSH